MIAFDYKRTMHKYGNIKEDNGPEIYQDQLEMCHIRNAHRLLVLFQHLGGVFIKFGQQIASLRYLIPDVYVDTLQVLQDHAPVCEGDVIVKMIEKELNRPLNECFSKFALKPISSASIAQVHHAVTLDGTEVAVKVQYPYLEKIVSTDIYIISVIFSW